MEKITSSRWFNLASWAVTAFIVAGAFGFAFWRINNPVMAAPAATKIVSSNTQVIPTSAAVVVSWFDLPAIERKLTLKTNIPQRPRYQVVTLTVQRGDAISRIAKEFGIEDDTLLFANYEVLEDNPHGLRPGQVLNIPPTDGILYEWKDGDKLEKIAAEYKAKLEDVLNWPGNNIDLTAPNIKSGQMVMLPGGTRESRGEVLITSGGGPASTGCPFGGASRGFWAWPSVNNYLSGSDFSGGHPGIDIAADEGSPIFAADSGVVTMSQDGWNSGYGSVVQIDHGNGFVTVYAHLSVRNVNKCQVVSGGTPIGAAGNTGNSFGAHLHFEIRLGSARVNPWDYLP